jgi:SAM-dependent methyltransferase
MVDKIIELLHNIIRSKLMALNENMVCDFYTNSEKEDNRAYTSRARGLEFHYTKKLLDKYISKETLVIEIGCATGYYGIYLHDKCKEYTGVDITPKHIEKFNKKITELKIDNIKTFIGDAVNITNIDNNSFDVVLVFGPMYHLSIQERELALLEAKRICKNDGIIMCSYVNKLGGYLQEGILASPEKYPNKLANEFILEKGTDDIKTDLFFLTTPEEMESMAISKGLKVIENCGVDFLFDIEHINTMNDEMYKCWIELSDKMFSSKSCTGLSIHAVMVCGKS